MRIPSCNCFLMYSFLFILILTVGFAQKVLGSQGYPIPPLRGADHWFTMPVPGEQVKEDNRWKVMLWRADKWRQSETWRYYPHISSRYYADCSYYKYVDCRDSRFCRCWQCKDYYYPEDAVIDGYENYYGN